MVLCIMWYCGWKRRIVSFRLEISCAQDFEPLCKHLFRLWLLKTNLFRTVRAWKKRGQSLKIYLILILHRLFLRIVFRASHESRESEGPSETRHRTGNVAYVDDKDLDLCLAEEASCWVRGGCRPLRRGRGQGQWASGGRKSYSSRRPVLLQFTWQSFIGRLHLSRQRYIIFYQETIHQRRVESNRCSKNVYVKMDNFR